MVSLEPTSVEGILNTISTVGAMTEAEDAAVELVESLRDAARGDRDEGPGAARGGVTAAARRRPGVARPAVRASATGCPSRSGAPAAGTSSARTASRLGQTTWDAVAEVDPEMLAADAVRLPPRARPSTSGSGRRAGRTGSTSSTAVQRGNADRARRLGVLLAARPAGRRRDRDAGRDLRPRGVRRRPRRRAAGRRSPEPWPASTTRAARRRSPACGAADRGRSARPTTSRAGPSSARTASARPATTRSSGSGCATALEARARRRRRRGDRGRARPRRRPRRAARRHATPAIRPEMVAYYEARAGEYDDWYLRRGRYAHGPIHDAAWNAELDARRPLARRPADRRARSWSSPPGTGWWSPLLAVEGRAVDLRRRRGAARSRPRAPRRPRPARPPPRPRRVGRAGSAGRRAVLRLLAEPRRARPHGRRSSRSPGAGSSPAAGSRSSTRCPIPQSGAADHPPPADDRRVRRLDDGREFTIVKVYCDARRARGRARGRRLRRRRGHDDRPVLRPRRPRGAPDRRCRVAATAAPRTGRIAGRAILRPDDAPREPNDRDRRLRRDGRGDDRRPAPGRARRARPGRREPSRAPSGATTSSASTGSGSSADNVEAIDERRRRPARDQAPDARPGSAARSGRSCGAASSSCRSSPGRRRRP